MKSRHLYVAQELVKSIVADKLRNTIYWRLSSVVHARSLSVGYWVGFYSDHNRNHPDNRFDLNIVKDICYLVEIEILPELRGKGHGERFYNLVEEIANALGCTQIIQTPSGITYNKETRKSYVQRKLGYTVYEGSVSAHKLLKKGVEK